MHRGSIVETGVITAIIGSTILAEPKGLAVDKFGNLYIADAGNGLIHKYSTSGAITTIAGGGSDFTNDVPSTARESVKVVVLSNHGF